jgi:hypothetical protein
MWLPYAIRHTSGLGEILSHAVRSVSSSTLGYPLIFVSRPASRTKFVFFLFQSPYWNYVELGVRTFVRLAKMRSYSIHCNPRWKAVELFWTDMFAPPPCWYVNGTKLSIKIRSSSAHIEFYKNKRILYKCVGEWRSEHKPGPWKRSEHVCSDGQRRSCSLKTLYKFENCM